MYAPPVTPLATSVGMTSRYDRSLEIRLSVSNAPSGSDRRAISAPNEFAASGGACRAISPRTHSASNVERAARDMRSVCALPLALRKSARAVETGEPGAQAGQVAVGHRKRRAAG